MRTLAISQQNCPCVISINDSESWRAQSGKCGLECGFGAFWGFKNQIVLIFHSSLCKNVRAMIGLYAGVDLTSRRMVKLIHQEAASDPAAPQEREREFINQVNLNKSKQLHNTNCSGELPVEATLADYCFLCDCIGSVIYLPRFHKSEISRLMKAA